MNRTIEQHNLLPVMLAGGQPDAAIMVGDTHTDIQTAQNAGVPVIAVDFGYSHVGVDSLGADRIVSSFDALFPTAVDLLR